MHDLQVGRQWIKTSEADANGLIESLPVSQSQSTTVPTAVGSCYTTTSTMYAMSLSTFLLPISRTVEPILPPSR